MNPTLRPDLGAAITGVATTGIGECSAVFARIAGSSPAEVLLKTPPVPRPAHAPKIFAGRLRVRKAAETNGT